MRRHLAAGRRFAAAAAVAGLVWLLLGSVPVARVQGEGATITGTWVFTTVFGPVSLPTLVTFHADGTIAASDSMMFGGIPGLPYKVTPFHGVWERTRRLRFGGTSLMLVFDPVTNVPVGIARVRSDIHFDGNYDHLAGTMWGELLPCPTPFTCPDPTDPGAQWVPTSPAVPFTAVRLRRVPAGPLQ